MTDIIANMDETMDCIFVSGTASAEPIGAWKASICRVVLAVTAVTMLTGASDLGELEINIPKLRNDRGMLHLCLTQDPKAFLDCRADPAARKLSLPANAERKLHFGGLAPGSYVVAVIHDENGNGKLDTILAIPREGFGFSRNPKIRMGPPRFDEVRFQINSGANRQSVEMKYLL
jgi:uncharacterized protein (DUF2141 family)